MPASDHAALADLLRNAVREAGALALTYVRDDLKHWTKDKDSPVSEADIAVDALLKERLGGTQYPWLSEEVEDDPARLDARRVWIVDPIDGTRAFIARRPDWTISAALVEDGRPIVAAVFAPVTDEFFFAIHGAGATRNDTAIRVSTDATLVGASVAGPKRVIDNILAHEPSLAVTPRIHSLALRFTRVAQGTLDIALAGGNSHDWDLAAADLLVHEAGGTLTTLTGEAARYNRREPVHGPLLAAGPARSRVLRDLLHDWQP
ncbi:MAG: 3'(2'),5'-bisphosphate nucleotidase CysQ [Xanthobacteraceae bacterium]